MHIWQTPDARYKYIMRRDLGDDRPDDRRLDPAQVAGIKKTLANDPRRRIDGISRLLKTIIWLMVAAALILVCVYYGSVLWHGLKAGNTGEQRYREMVRENGGD